MSDVRSSPEGGTVTPRRGAVGWHAVTLVVVTSALVLQLLLVVSGAAKGDAKVLLLGPQRAAG